MEQREDARTVSGPPVALTVGPRHRDLGGLLINRVWPTARRRLIGPFIFFDHLLPVRLPPGRGLDVPPHPHIGLATVTYLFAGELLHRDSLGTVQRIGPGDLNWMTAGAGIVHSERSTEAARAAASELHGIQIWVALPRAEESASPRFEHYPRTAIPHTSTGDITLTIIAGTAFGRRSPAVTATELFYVEARMPAGTELVLDAELGERAAYIVAGELAIGAQRFPAQRLLVLEASGAVTVRARADSIVMLFGGAPLGEERSIWWNFVASTEALIESAKARWAAGGFPPVPGDDDRMPLPR